MISLQKKEKEEDQLCGGKGDLGCLSENAVIWADL